MRDYNPYQQNIVADFLSGYQAGEGIQDRKQERADKASDRAYQQTRRDRQTLLDNRTDADYEANQPLVNAKRADDLIALGEAPDIRAHNKRVRDSADSELLTPEEAGRSKTLKLDSAQQSLDNAKLSAQSTRQEMGIRGRTDNRSQKTFDDEEQGKVLLGNIARLDHGISSLTDGSLSRLRDPQRRQDAIDVLGAIHDGENPAQFGNKFYGVFNDAFADDIRKVVGKKVGDDTIVDAQATDVREQGDNLMIGMDVTYKRPDGSTYVKHRPITKDRSTDDSAEVAQIPTARLLDKATQYAGVALHAENGELDLDQTQQQLQAARSELRAQYLTLTGKDPDAAKPGEAGSITKDLNDLTKSYAGGDKQKAIQLYKELKQSTQKMTDPASIRLKVIQGLTTQGNLKGKALTDEADKVTAWITKGGKEMPAADEEATAPSSRPSLDSFQQ